MSRKKFFSKKNREKEEINKERKTKSFKDLFSNIILAISIILLLFSAYSTMKFGEKAYFMGYKPIYMGVGTMAPEIPEGSILLVKKTSIDKIIPGDVVVYRMDNKTIIHRVVNREGDILSTKADALPTMDTYSVTKEQVSGKVVFSTALLASFLTSIGEPLGLLQSFLMPIFVFVGILIAFILILQSFGIDFRSKNPKKRMNYEATEKIEPVKSKTDNFKKPLKKKPLPEIKPNLSVPEDFSKGTNINKRERIATPVQQERNIPFQVENEIQKEEHKRIQEKEKTENKLVLQKKTLKKKTLKKVTDVKFEK